MLFNSPVFVVQFLPACLAGFFLLGWLGGPAWALRWLVAASLFFYGWWNPPFVLLLAGSIGINYAVGQRILRLRQAGRPARWWLRGGIAFDLGLLGWFKYADFFLVNFSDLTGLPVPALRVFLPLAISFFTFQQIMFVVDSYRQQRQDLGFLPYAAFVAFFPHLIAGPIVRPREIIPQFAAADLARPRLDNLGIGIATFLLGLAKKLVVADTIGAIADAGFNAAANGRNLTCIEAWIATLAYALQLYFDFSGYSDMAIGLARMLNISFPLNFDSPYKSRNISEFWRRWHITLGQFLRDYVYIGLGGNRRGELRRNLNLMATMLLGGLWHGAGWTFVLWGGLHGAYLVGHAQLRRVLPAAPARLRPVTRVLSHVLLLLAVAVAWVPFRADGLGTAWRMLRDMAGLNGVVLSPFLVDRLPWHPAWLHPGQVIPIIGDGRPLALPQCLLLIGAAGLGTLALPHIHQMSERARLIAIAASFGLAMQALFFAPNISPFLYFRF